MVIIGSGLVGLDAASGLLEQGKRVIIVEMAERILPIQLDEKGACEYQRRFEAAGCQFRLGRKGVDTVCNDSGEVVQVVLDDGEKLDCDLVIVAAGVRSAVAGLEDSGLDIDRGIKVNGYMHTSAPEVYAAGDVTGSVSYTHLKTMSTVYPSVRAVGAGLAEKIFYLTAKTITRTVAQEAFLLLQEKGVEFKVATITAKEKLCLCDEMECNPQECPYARGHFDRINEAVYELWTTKNHYTRDILQEHARKWQVCPFEMCLDLSVWTDGVICDYNYVFDPNVYLKRFFAEGTKGDYIFLIDEAHNLVDRGRQMYSAALYKEEVLKIRKSLKPYGGKVIRELNRLNQFLLELKRECESYEVLESIGNLPVLLMKVMGELESFL